MNNLARNYVLYITNHFTHPMKDAQLASPRYHLTRALARKGVKLIVYCPLGRVAGKPLNDFFSNLRPRRYTEEKIVYLFPPLLRIPGRLGTGLSLVIGTLFLAAFVTLTRTKITAQYSTTILVAAVGAVVRKWFNIPLVANYGDPDYARESGASRLVLKFCEDLVLTRKNTSCVVTADEAISDYVRRNFPVKKVCFLPSGGYDKESIAESANSSPLLVRKALGLGNAPVVIYAGQLSPPFRVDLLIPAAERTAKIIPNIMFVVIGGGSELPRMRMAARQAGLESHFLFLGPVPYSMLGPYVDASDVGLQLTNDICMGTKVILYMVHKKPVISIGRWYDHYRLFLRNGDNCLLLPPDAEGLSEKLIQLLKDPSAREVIAARGWETVAPYTWERHAAEVMEWLRDAKTADKTST